MIKNITLNPGDTLTVSVPETVAAPPADESFDVLLKIGSVSIFTAKDKSYVCFTSDLDICNDGCGPSHGDTSYQAQTAYYSGGREGNKYLNADVDHYIVVPPQIRSMVPGVVMGCRGQVTNLKTQVAYPGVVGDIGPDDITGECAYSLAKKLNPMVEHNVGDSSQSYLYELWPDQPATVEGFTYKLQPA